MESQILFNILLSFSIYLLVSISFSIIYSSIKFFNFAHAGIISFGAYFAYLFSQQFNLSLFLSIPIAIFLSILLILIIEFIIYKPLRKKHTTPLLMLIASLGLYVVLQNCISLLWGDNVKSIRTGEIKVGNEFFGAYISNIQLLTIIVSIAFFITFLFFFKFHKLGRKIRAISANAELASIMGINSDKVILWSLGLGSGIAVIAGILVASDTGLTPTMGFNLLLYGVVAMIIGGLGSTWGLVGGSLLLATAQHLGAYYVDSKWMDAIAYIILILFLIWKPLGFSGKRLKKVEI